MSFDRLTPALGITAGDRRGHVLPRGAGDVLARREGPPAVLAVPLLPAEGRSSRARRRRSTSRCRRSSRSSRSPGPWSSSRAATSPRRAERAAPSESPSSAQPSDHVQIASHDAPTLTARLISDVITRFSAAPDRRPAYRQGPADAERSDGHCCVHHPPATWPTPNGHVEAARLAATARSHTTPGRLARHPEASVTPASVSRPLRSRAAAARRSSRDRPGSSRQSRARPIDSCCGARDPRSVRGRRPAVRAASRCSRRGTSRARRRPAPRSSSTSR